MANVVCHQGEVQGEAIRWPQRAEPIRPFDQHSTFPRIIPAEFVEGLRTVQAPEVEMRDGAPWRFISLHQGKAGAGDVQHGITGQGPQEGAREGGFSGAEFTLQQNRVPHADQRGHPRGEAFRGGKVGEGEGKGGHEPSVAPGRIRGQPVPARMNMG